MMKKMSASKAFFLLLSIAFIVMFFSAFLLTRYSSIYQTGTTQQTETESKTGTVPVVRSTPTSIPSQTPEPTPVSPTPEPTPQEVKTLMIPAEGTISQIHSMETLVYSETTGDWKAHNGIDISGPQTEVKAAAPGIVSEVSSDGLLGQCIVIDHQGGLQSRYYGMEETYAVLNQSVDEGEVIGLTGIASPSEAAEGTHLHFEVWKNDQPLDPLDFFA